MLVAFFMYDWRMGGALATLLAMFSILPMYSGKTKNVLQII